MSVSVTNTLLVAHTPLSDRTTEEEYFRRLAGGSPTESTVSKKCSTFIPAMQRHTINFSGIPFAQVTEVSLLLRYPFSPIRTANGSLLKE